MENKNTNSWDIKPGNQNININNSPQKTDPKIIISIICGILAILCEVISFLIVGREYDPSETVNEFLVITNISKVIMSLPIPLSIAGIVFALSAREGSRFRKTGMVLNIVILAAVTLFPVLALFFIMMMWEIAISSI